MRMPGGTGKLQKTEYDWQFQTEPEPALGGFRSQWPRGKVLGGCSSINFMCVMQGLSISYLVPYLPWSPREFVKALRPSIGCMCEAIQVRASLAPWSRRLNVEAVGDEMFPVVVTVIRELQ